MRKILYIILPILLVVSCSTNNSNKSSNNPPMSTNPTKVMNPIFESPVNSEEESKDSVVGGWVPVFFSWMDTKQLAGITDGMNEGKIRRVMISYPPKMQNLAGKIQSYLQSQTKQNIEMQSIELKDTDQVSYNLTQVIVTLYFK